MDATQTTLSAYNNLTLRSLGPFRVTADFIHWPVINKHKIDSVVSPDPGTRALLPKRSDPANNLGTRQKAEKNRNAQPQFTRCKTSTAKANGSGYGRDRPKYAVD